MPGENKKLGKWIEKWYQPEHKALGIKNHALCGIAVKQLLGAPSLERAVERWVRLISEEFWIAKCRVGSTFSSLLFRGQQNLS